MTNTTTSTWAVAQVWRGIPASVKLFAAEAEARRHVAEVRETIAAEDEVRSCCVSDRAAAHRESLRYPSRDATARRGLA